MRETCGLEWGLEGTAICYCERPATSPPPSTRAPPPHPLPTLRGPCAPAPHARARRWFPSRPCCTRTSRSLAGPLRAFPKHPTLKPVDSPLPLAAASTSSFAVEEYGGGAHCPLYPLVEAALYPQLPLAGGSPLSAPFVATLLPLVSAVAFPSIPSVVPLTLLFSFLLSERRLTPAQLFCCFLSTFSSPFC